MVILKRYITMKRSPKLSVVIPTLNEEHTLPILLERLLEILRQGDEIIVVDGGSSDRTVSIARQFNVCVLHSPKTGRAAQLDFGARSARSDYLCFLHSDTSTPDKLAELIHHTLSNEKVVLGGFVSIMRGKETRWLISFLNYSKTYLAPLFYKPYAFFFKGLRLLFGDQVMFCRRSDYLKSGGFNTETMIMEEAELCLSMNKLGRIQQVHRLVYSSDRRVAQLGLWKAIKIYLYVAMGWVFGFSSKELSARYEHIR